jgi:amidohydrolase
MRKMFQNQKLLHDLSNLRKSLHKNPELSGFESETALFIEEQIQKSLPDKIYKNIGGNSIAFEFSSNKPGPTVVFRADLDALPIKEELEKDYKSGNEGISHKCGHDGHMTILVGLASLIQKQRPARGKLILLFQAEEETGKGALKVINDPRWKEINPDYVFGLHNLPRFPLHSILIRNDTFAAASCGMIIQLKGKTSHAGHPEDGINPANAISQIIELCGKSIDQSVEHFKLITIIHIELGEKAFGTSPGEGSIMLTLRTYEDEVMKELKRLLTDKINSISKSESLQTDISFTEEFPATINQKEELEKIKEAAEDIGLEIIIKKEPFRWSEDFGHYLKNHKGAFFGLGSGLSCPQLHNPDYDFPDSIIPTGIQIYYALYEKYLIQ